MGIYSTTQLELKLRLQYCTALHVCWIFGGNTLNPSHPFPQLHLCYCSRPCHRSVLVTSRRIALRHAITMPKVARLLAYGIVLIFYQLVFVYWQHHRLDSSISIQSAAATLPENTISYNDAARNYTALPSSFYRPALQILKSEKLPSWVKEYVTWHKEQRSRYLEALRYNSTSLLDIKFLISRCFKHDTCGGLSDRLQDMPLI